MIATEQHKASFCKKHTEPSRWQASGLAKFRADGGIGKDDVR